LFLPLLIQFDLFHKLFLKEVQILMLTSSFCYCCSKFSPSKWSSDVAA